MTGKADDSSEIDRWLRGANEAFQRDLAGTLDVEAGLRSVTSRLDGEPTEMPADLAAVAADDALLDMLGNPSRTPDEVDGELALVLTAWRREVQADSNRVLVDTDTALSVISAARRDRGRSWWGVVATAVAVLLIGVSTVGLVSKSAQPGDTLWGVTRVLYADYARSVEAAALVRGELDEASVALGRGRRSRDASPNARMPSRERNHSMERRT